MDTPPTTALKYSLNEQVELRISILQRWIEKKEISWRMGLARREMQDQSGELVPDFVPTSLLQFCAWTAEKSCAASEPDVANLRPISRMSLYQACHADLRTRVEAKLGSAKACLTHQLGRSKKASIIVERNTDPSNDL